MSIVCELFFPNISARRKTAGSRELPFECSGCRMARRAFPIIAQPLEVAILRRRAELVVDFLTLCEQAAQAGAQTLVDWIGRFQVTEKGPADLVTEADAASQEAIRKVLMAAVPDHGFVGEEGSRAGRSEAEYCWVADPLDGTTNYVHQVPHYAVSLALAASRSSDRGRRA